MYGVWRFLLVESDLSVHGLVLPPLELQATRLLKRGALVVLKHPYGAIARIVRYYGLRKLRHHQWLTEGLLRYKRSL